MNEHLKFSWGHIIAFLAIIFISYTTFAGTTYLTVGNFKTAAIVTASIDAGLLIVFIGVQTLKATDRKFRRCIWIERVFFCLSPFIFIAAMVPHSHFFTVIGKSRTIVSSFKESIESSKQMFVDYEVYSDARINNYDSTLESIINSGKGEKYGFTKGKEKTQKDNMTSTLRLQLLSSNYDTLKDSALKWIDSADKGASTLNVFLIGNVRQISEAIHGWNDQLVAFSEQKMSNEEVAGCSVRTFAGSNGSLDKVDNGFDALNMNFSTMRMPGGRAVITAVILYLMLLFPYCLQDRHTKSHETLLPKKKGLGAESTLLTEDKGNAAPQQSDEWEPFTM